jgi:DNA-binding GntR family transcriptional regulator
MPKPSEQIGALRASHRTLRELAQDEIKRDILSARFRPGDRLNEVQLASRYGISRGPIREALRALEGQGLLRFFSNRGAVVTSLSEAEIREIFDMRFALERLAAVEGVKAITDAELDEMSSLLRLMSAARDDSEQYLLLNNEFHLTLYRASGHSRLCASIVELMDSLQPYVRMHLSLPDKLMATDSGHGPIFDAARKRNAEHCADLTVEHLKAGAAIVTDLLSQSQDSSEGLRP